MSIELLFLGTGTSQGVPMIGCDCSVCCSDDPRDQRSRTSVIISLDGHNILIDATPELRLQCIQNNIRQIEACLLTHAHADHLFGLDDLRRFNQLQNAPIDIYVSDQHRASLEKVFGYAQATPQRPVIRHIDLPQFIFHTIDPQTNTFELFGHEIKALPLPHGSSTSIGYRIGKVAYCTDLSFMSEEVAGQLVGLEVLVLDALRAKPHPAHLSFDQAIALAGRIGAKRTFFTHMSHNTAHSSEEDLFPPEIRFAYDGLKITVNE